MTEAEAMEADVETVRIALSGYSGTPLPRWPARGEALAALTRLSDRLQRYEGALREIVMAEPDVSGPQTPWPSFSGQLQNIAARALNSPATQETGE